MLASASYDVRRAASPEGATGPASADGPSFRNKPDNTAFTQQRLPAWQPLLSAGTVLPLFFFLGVAFLAVGLGLHFSSEGIQELEVDYTGVAGDGSDCGRCANLSASPGHKKCTCAVSFTLSVDFPAPVCLYYQLSNYYQNNRRYSISRDDAQLSGSAWALRNPIQDCQPYRWNGSGFPIAPCGSIANSLFNDTFALYRMSGKDVVANISLDRRGISWWTDNNVKFRNPEPVNGSLALAFKGTAKPPFWPEPVYNLSANNPNNTGFVNEGFIVWMRIAALPSFRKLYACIHRGNSSVALPRGHYSLNITYNYPVLAFRGTKKVIFSTLSWMGGKNSFLGIAYLVVGSVCIVTGVVMLVVHLKYRHLNEED
uniref:Cell cycle control protein n=1 Tax=Pogona vitticeps TaxID=103695 RepID=A0ABM5EU22_9SAUR